MAEDKKPAAKKPATNKPTFDAEKEHAQCFGRSDNVRYIQDSNCFDGGGKFLGKAKDDGSLEKGK
jgi:hypothetical protein